MVPSTRQSIRHDYTWPTTVLIVDDDPVVVDMISSDTLKKTSLGVVTATSLSEAHSLIQSRIPIAAVLTDINFTPATHDQKNALHSGADLLKYVAEACPAAIKYGITMVGRSKVTLSDCGVRQIYDKWQPADQIGPWTRIENDIISDLISTNPEFRKLQRDEENEVAASKARLQFNQPRLTYLQSAFFHQPDYNSNYKIIRPIPIHVAEERGLFVANTIGFPMLASVEASEIPEAMNILRERIFAEYEQLKNNEKRLVGYARYFYEQIRDYVTE